VRIQQEERNETDGQVTNTSQLGEGRLFGVPTKNQGDQQDVDHHQVNTQRPDKAFLEGMHGKENDDYQSAEKEVSIYLLVAALKKEEGNQQPEKAEETEHIAEVLAVVTGDSEQEHPDSGE
jgi:hypothetical protein